VPRLRRVSSDDVLDRAREDVAVVGKTRREWPVDAAQRTRTHEKQLKQNSSSNNTTGAAVAGGARHRTRQATAHTQQQEQQDEHKELEKQDVQEEQGRTGRANHSIDIPLQRGVWCSPSCSCSAVISVASLTRQPCLRSTTHDRVEELSETRQCADKTCHMYRGQQCSNHQQHTIAV
jgi:hypothetical protein